MAQAKNRGLFLVLVLLLSCHKAGGLGPLDYVRWIEDPKNGLKVVKELGEYDFSLQYKPYAYVVLKDKRTPKISEPEMKKAIADINDLEYYTLRVGLHSGEGDLLKHDLTSVQNYTDKVEYFSFGVQNDLKLVDGSDTLNCALVSFERTFGITPYINLVLAFPNDSASKSKNRTLIYDDKMLGTGKVMITINASDIDRTPNLKL